MASWDMEGVLDDIKSDVFETLLGFVVWLVNWAADMIEGVDVPEFMAPMAGYIGNIPPEVAYFVSVFELPYAFTVIGAALSARLMLGLIPYIGGAFR